MNAKKSADYRNLIEIVKNKYRKNPIYAKSLTLGWCDLRQGEDLCQEIKKLDKDDKKNVILYTQLHLIISCLEEVELCLIKMI